MSRKEFPRYEIINSITGESFGTLYYDRASAERALARAMRLRPLKGSDGWEVRSDRMDVAAAIARALCDGGTDA